MDDRVWFRVPTDTATYRHLRRDGLVCCVVESKPDDSTYYGIKGAMLHGRAEVLDEGAGPAVHQALATRPDPVTPTRTDGVVFSVGLDDSTSFAFEKIQGRYQDKQVEELQEAAERG
jgi:hypothetical protein